MRRAEDAMFEQVTQLRWLESPHGQKWTHNMQRSLDEQYPEDDRMPPGLFYLLEHQMLKEADPVYVSPDVCEVINHARETFQPEPLLPTDPFAMAGFAVFAKPLLLPDNPVTIERLGGEWEDKPMTVSAMGWYPVHDGNYEVGCFWISFYVGFKDDVWDVGQRMMDHNPLARLTLAHKFQWSWHTAPWLDEETGPAHPRGPLSIDDGVPVDEDPTKVRARGLAQVGAAQVFWRIAQQLVPAREQVPRAYRKDAKRHGLDRDKVTVIKLRREHKPDLFGPEEDGEGRYSHRWITRGHWRQQWYPSLQTHRQIWINPYVKGPEGAPLKLTTRAFDFSR
jgi:hypothetical protein